MAGTIPMITPSSDDAGGDCTHGVVDKSAITEPPRVARRRARYGKPGIRHGAAMVEMAVCLPVIILIVFGAMEAAGMIFLKQALVQSAYEAVKIASKSDGTESAARTAATNVVNGRNLENVTVSFSPANVENVQRGDIVRVTVTAPADSNTYINFGFFRGRTLTVTSAMMKE